MTLFDQFKRRARKWSAIATLGFLLSTAAFAADNSPQVTFNAGKAGPRAVEPLTQRAIVRDYTFAWANLDSAFASSSEAAINSLFAGDASASLKTAIDGQRRTGIRTRYLNQSHKLEAVFYSPEGDVIELHDTAEYDLEIRDGEKTIHNEHAVVHYVLLMTPGEERWMIRQLEAVPQF